MKLHSFIHTVLLKFPLKDKRGFTLMETLFAMLIFTSSLVMLISVSARGLSATITSREELAARYLAVEGLEVVRNMRDSNFVTSGGADWLANISDVCTPECHVVTSPGVVLGLAPESAVLFVDEQTGGYTAVDQGGSVPSKFTQRISVEPTGQEGEVVVTSRIEWTARGARPRVIEYSNYLEQWRR